MVALTPLVRAKAYVLLATLTFVVLALALFALWMPYWSTVSTTSGVVSRGIFATCTNQNSAWDNQICVSIDRQNPCDSWFQATRAFAIIGAVLAVLLIIVAFACAMQGTITRALPTVGLVFAFFMMICMMMTWVSWFIFRGKTCQAWDGQPLGSSFVVQIFAWLLAFVALLLAIYLWSASVLVAAPDAPIVYKGVESAPMEATYYAQAPVAYTAAPIAPTYSVPPTYSAAPTFAPTYAPTYAPAPAY